MSQSQEETDLVGCAEVLNDTLRPDGRRALLAERRSRLDPAARMQAWRHLSGDAVRRKGAQHSSS